MTPDHYGNRKTPARVARPGRVCSLHCELPRLHRTRTAPRFRLYLCLPAGRFDILVTAAFTINQQLWVLWIALATKPVQSAHALLRRTRKVRSVQIVSLIYWSQRKGNNRPIYRGCELLSDCIFDILVTAISVNVIEEKKLWIAFRLYLWYIGHSSYRLERTGYSVVNCFQIVSLIYWSQLKIKFYLIIPRCELLSDCIFDILVTAFHHIALVGHSCELLSDCIFDILVTAALRKQWRFQWLWIAFRLYLWYIGHS